MGPIDRAGATAALRAFCAAHPAWALFDEAGEMLYDVGAGRGLRLPLGEVVGVAERLNAQTGRPYLVVVLGGGGQLALADAGIAFPPLAQPIPQAPPMPPVVCLGDFAAALGRLRHQVFGHPDQKPDRTTLDLVALCLGILGGARQVGFDVAVEERALEPVLEELEKR